MPWSSRHDNEIRPSSLRRYVGQGKVKPMGQFLRQWWKWIAAVATAILWIWTAGDRVLDAYGHAGALAELLKPDNIIIQGLLWLFSTPSWVPAGCAVVLTSVLVWGLLAGRKPPHAITESATEAWDERTLHERVSRLHAPASAMST
jgi:hypothetical protein